MNESCHTYEWFMSHVWLSHAKHMIESCHTYEWVMLQTWISHVTQVSMHPAKHEYVTSRMSHVTHMNESCHTYEWVMSHIWMSQVMQVMSHRSLCIPQDMSIRHFTNESCHLWRNHANGSCHIWRCHGISTSRVTKVSMHPQDMNTTRMSHVNDEEIIQIRSWPSKSRVAKVLMHPRNLWIFHVTHVNESCHIWRIHVLQVAVHPAGN